MPLHALKHPLNLLQQLILLQAVDYTIVLTARGTRLPLPPLVGPVDVQPPCIADILTMLAP